MENMGTAREMTNRECNQATLSFQDVLAGLLYVFIMLAAFLFRLDNLDELVTTHPLAPVFSIALPILLCYCYPKLDRWSTARGDTTVIVSVASGVCTGAHVGYKLGLFHFNSSQSPFSPTELDAALLLLVAARLLVGLTIVVSIRSLMKWLSLRFIAWYWRIDTSRKENLRALPVELLHKFSVYFSLGFSAIVVVPLVFRALNIHRESYFNEL